MLKLTWIELFLRSIPEMLILIWGIYVISRTPINKRNYIVASIITGIMAFFVRWLPIYFGVHMVISIVLIIAIVVIIGIPIIKAIYSTLLLTFILSLSEFVNMLILSLFNIDASSQFLNPIIKCIFFIPSLVITMTVIIMMNYLINIKKAFNRL